MSNPCNWNDAELSLGLRERTIRPSTSNPVVLMFPAALIDFSPTCLQSTTSLAWVLVITTCTL